MHRRSLIAFLLAPLLALASAHTADADSETVALATQGRVTIVRAGVGDIALAPGIVIEPGDHLVSDDEGRALIRWSDEALFTVGPFSQVLFEGASTVESIGTVALLSGDVRVLKRPNEAARRAIVRTKSAEIAVGDGYLVAGHERAGERTRIVVLSGSADVSRADSDRVRFTVLPNQSSVVDETAGPAIPQLAPPELIDTMKTRTAIRYAPEPDSLPGQVRNLGDNPLRDIPTKLTGSVSGTGIGPSSAAEFEAFPTSDNHSPDIPEGLDIDRESDVSLVIIFNDLIAKNRPLEKK